MGPTEAVSQREQQYLQAIYELAEGKAKAGISFREVQECVSCSDDEADYCCDFWTRRGAVEWPALGHIALTHLGLAWVKRMDNPGLDDPHFCAILRTQGSAEDEARDVNDGLAGRGADTISVVIPVLDEAKTLGHLVRMVRLDPRVFEVVVIDDGSIDSSAEIALQAGARVVVSSFLGKGASMEDGLKAARRDIVLFLDGDLREIRGDFVERMIAPILAKEADMVKARFSRDAGRVTVLTARPLLSAFFPELADFGQPLGGIVALRRSLLGSVRLENDYGVDVGLLIDAMMKGARVTEVDIGQIDHNNQSLEVLGETARQVTRVILDRAWKHDRLSINQVRHMEEIERRAKAEVLPTAEESDSFRKFALFDMDGVLLDGRFALELARRVGAEDELSRFLDNTAVAEPERTYLIASLFTGVSKEVFEETARSMPLMDGAVEIVLTLRRLGYRVGIVTDSFHVAADIVRRRVFADFSVANIMHFHRGVATGQITLSPATVDPDGCPRHPRCKSNVLRYLSATAGLVPTHTLAVGDGGNDICMLREAGASVAFRPKSKLVEKAAKHTLSRSLLDILDLLSFDKAPGTPGVNPAVEVRFRAQQIPACR